MIRQCRPTRLAVPIALGAWLGATAAFAFQQSPVLDEAVASGELPAIEDRLPSEPQVVEAESVGTYGGTWRMGMRGGADAGLITKTVAYEGLLRFDHDWQEVLPNLAVSWETSEDAREHTFKLREGVKWSDGTPFTTEDIAFAVEIYQDGNYPASSSWIDSPNNPMRIEVIDETTFKFIFENPNGMMLNQLASVDGIHITSMPKAYCSQFHPNYNENADTEAQAAGFSSWALWMEDRCAWGWENIRFANPDLPSLYAWQIETPYTANNTRVTWQRNPYYWKVDAEGNQLPYMDTVDMRVSESIEELTLLALSGQIDFQERHIATNINRPLFFDGQEQGGYHLGEVIPTGSNMLVLQLNLNHGDPVKRELFQNKDFRVGLSHAIDRQEIIDVVFTGQGEPFQVAPRPESPLYDEEMAKQYTEFDPDLAVQHFQAAGLTETNGDGLLLMSNGQPVSITIDVISALRPEWTDMLELMQLQLAAAGIEIEINAIDRTLFYEKRPGNDFDAQVWEGSADLTVIDDPRYYMPFNQESAWAFRWQSWFNNTNPEIAEEPVEWAREQMDLYRQAIAAPTADERMVLTKQILEIAKEQFPVIGVNLMPNGYSIIRNNLKNAPESMFNAWLFPTPAPMDPTTWYFE